MSKWNFCALMCYVQGEFSGVVGHTVNTEVRFMLHLCGLPWSSRSVLHLFMIRVRKDPRFLLVHAIAIPLNLSNASDFWVTPQTQTERITRLQFRFLVASDVTAETD